MKMKMILKKITVIVGFLTAVVCFSDFGYAAVLEDTTEEATPPDIIIEEGTPPSDPMLDSGEETKEQIPEYAPGEVLVKFKEGVDPNLVLKEINLETKSIERVHSIKPAVAKFKKDYKLEKDSEGWYPFLGKNYKEVDEIPNEEMFKEAYSKMPDVEKALYRSYKITLPEGMSVEEAMEQLKNDPNIEYAEPNYIARIFYIPSDPLYTQQWAHQKTNAQNGWDIERGNPDVVIAIVDTGVDYNHEDFLDTNNLDTNIWRDAQGNPGKDFVNINTGAYLQQGYTLVSDDYTVVDYDPNDYNGHGTHVAGIADAAANNIGVVGVSHNCKIMPVRAGFSIIHPSYGEVGLFEYDDISNAIKYAADNNANIISMSFGGPDSYTMKAAIDYASQKGVVLVAAAGNGSTDSTLYSYPGAYSNVFAVAATDSADIKAYFSNYGTWVDITAPGLRIVSTVPRSGGVLTDPSGYKTLSGTSMAAPYVAGLAALVLSKESGSSEDTLLKIYHSADNIDNVNPSYRGLLGGGRVNINNALVFSEPIYPEIIVLELKTDTWLGPNRQANIKVTIANKGTTARNLSAALSCEDPRVMINNSIFQAGDMNFLEESSGAFRISLDGNVLEGDILNFRINFNFNEDQSSEYDFQLHVPEFSGIKWMREFSGINAGGYRHAIADLDGDGTKETILILPGCAKSENIEGMIIALQDDGSDMPGWPIVPEPGRKNRIISFSVGDIIDVGMDGLSESEIIVVRGKEVVNGRWENLLYAYDYQGRLLAGFPKSIGNLQFAYGTSLLSDENGDGLLDIVVGSQEQIPIPTGFRINNWLSIYDGYGNAISSSILPKGPQYGAYLTLGDIDNDLTNEFAIGADRGTSTQPGGLRVFERTGELMNNWNVDTMRNYQICPITVGDLEKDNNMEVMAYDRSYSSGGLHVYDNKGNLLFGRSIPTSGLAAGEVIMSDLDNNGDLEIILSDYKGKVYAYHHNGILVEGWPVKPDTYHENTAYTEPCPQLVAADIDGDGFQEILGWTKIKSDPNVPVSEWYTTQLNAWNHDGTRVNGFPKKFPSDRIGSEVGGIAISDLDNNGYIDIVSVISYDYIGSIRKTNVFAIELDIPCNNFTSDWPMFRHDPQKTGRYSAPIINTPPVLNPIGGKTVDEMQILNFTITATDPDGDTLVYPLPVLPTGAAFTDNNDGTASFIWTPTYEQAEDYQVTFVVSDGIYTDSETITITINNVNRPPDISPIPTNLTKDEGSTITNAEIELATDPDNEPLTYTYSRWVTSLPYTIGYDEAGTHTLHVDVSDGTATVGKDITITVNNVNGPPAFDPIGNKTVNRLKLLRFTVNAKDPDNDKITYSVSNKPQGAHFNPITKMFMWMPSIRQAGDFEVTFIAKDTKGNKGTETITITVPNNPPVLNPIGDKKVKAGHLLQFKLSAIDPDKIDQRLLRYYADKLPRGAILTPSGIFIWRPTKAQIGTYPVRFYVKDPPGAIDDETITITVTRY